MLQPDFSAQLRWPDVPACYGWLSLDRRGRWRLRGEAVTHAGLRHFLDRQYGHDEDGNYFVQNGPQRVFVELAYTPWVLHLMAEGQLETHVGEAVDEVRSALIDDEGNLLLEIADGIALLSDRDLPRLRHCLHLPSGAPADDASVLAVIERQGQTRLTFAWAGSFVPVLRVQRCEVPARYAFVASPQPPMPRKSS